jgi:hypothetical protein
VNVVGAAQTVEFFYPFRVLPRQFFSSSRFPLTSAPFSGPSRVKGLDRGETVDGRTCGAGG